MIVYRLAQADHAQDMSGNGARLYGGRWNMKGMPALYASEHVSLCVLEVLVNAVSLQYLQALQLLEIEIANESLVKTIDEKKLKKDWFNDFAYTQWMGTEMLRQKDILVFRCPSAVIHNEWNYVFNTIHPSYKRLKVTNQKRFYFDERLWRTG